MRLQPQTEQIQSACICQKALVGTVGTPTLCQQQFDGARVALGGCQHQRGATLLLMDLDVCVLLQQQLHNLEQDDKRRGQERLNDEHPGGGGVNEQTAPNLRVAVFGGTEQRRHPPAVGYLQPCPPLQKEGAHLRPPPSCCRAQH